MALTVTDLRNSCNLSSLKGVVGMAYMMYMHNGSHVVSNIGM